MAANTDLDDRMYNKKYNNEFMRKVFCLETEWDFSKRKMRDKDSVQPMLAFLEQSMGVEYVFRNVATREDFKYYIEQLNYKTYKDYQIIFLAFHGRSKSIDIPSGDIPISFSELSEISKEVFQGRIIHFGSCRTLNTSNRIIQDFKAKTGAKLISGYTRSIDFIRSTIMDIAYFSELERVKNLGTINNRMDKLYGNLKEELGFKIF